MSGMKHATTEPAHLDNKRERRRGAAGRAAVLRRAPSDSDCSGETASLSADSGDRVVRPAPPPPRSAKTRSRRRGSEWEVLEGLKDGQRFDKRPEVFNGYLHKKRKWPLKGWHKRFFVVDGGILVYARSPTDVARGRLHGSVDVGLSVISAKARRRRIDIDADEFIYHLRAKTHDVFRTWLNVLKAHRLYRQHLLTFGARESVPKIHVPLEELPPTDTSSRTESTTSTSSEDFQKPPIHSPLVTTPITGEQNSWTCKPQDNELLPLQFEPLANTPFDEQLSRLFSSKSLCSMKCVTRKFAEKIDVAEKLIQSYFKIMNYSTEGCDAQNENLENGCDDFVTAFIDGDFPVVKRDVDNDKISKSAVTLTDTEKLMHATELDVHSTISPQLLSSIYTLYDIETFIDKSKSMINCSATEYSLAKAIDDELTQDIKKSCVVEKRLEPSKAIFFFSQKSNAKNLDSKLNESLIKRSKKSTNLVKYRNVKDEPPLQKPFSKCLLGKHKRKMDEPVIVLNSVSAEVQVELGPKESIALQDSMTLSEYDNITEQLILNIMEQRTGDESNDLKCYVNGIVKELYNVKWSQTETHPVKLLFRSLLEYWLKNTSIKLIKDAVVQVKSVDRQSNNHFTRDKNLSSILISSEAKQTQFHGFDFEELLPQKVTKPKSTYYKCCTDSFEKDRRIQQLEKLLKNTVYICEARRSSHTNIGSGNVTKLNNSVFGVNNDSSESADLPKVKNIIKQLLSETSVSPDVARDYLGEYLNEIIKSNKTIETSKTTDNSNANIKDINNDGSQLTNFTCEVQTDSTQNNISKSTITLDKKPEKNEIIDNSGDVTKSDIDEQTCDIFKKINTIFTKLNNFNSISSQDQKDKTAKKEAIKVELGRIVKEYSENGLISEHITDNSVAIDLSKYNLEHITMLNDPTVKGLMSINLKLKEKNIETSNHASLNLQVSNDTHVLTDKQNSWQNKNISASDHVLKKNIERPSFKNPFFEFDPIVQAKHPICLKPYSSSTDATSKAYFKIGSKKSMDISSVFNIIDATELEDKDDHQCYILSTFKKSGVNKSHSRTNNKDQNCSSPSSGQKLTQRVIDERFILLLLENLTLLSKNIPDLHKDINTLYLKLRKRHERILRDASNAHGLGLLGKIYNAKDVCTDDNCTQYDNHIDSVNSILIKDTVESAINTSNALIDKSFKDKCVSAHDIRELYNKSTDTEELSIRLDDKANDYCTIIKMSSSSQTYNMAPTHSKAVSDRAIPSPNWLQPLAERARDSIKKILEEDSNFKFTPKDSASNTIRLIIKKKVPENYDVFMYDHENKNEIKFIKEPWKVNHVRTKETKRFKERNSGKIRQDLIKEIRMQSQTDKGADNFTVYQLFVSNRNGINITSSRSESTVSKSDDLKTLYRCTSVPSYCSGLISPTSPPLRGPQAGFVSGTPGGRLAGWIIESGGPLESVSRELGQASLSVQQLQRLLDALELQQQVHHDTDMPLVVFDVRNSV